MLEIALGKVLTLLTTQEFNAHGDCLSSSNESFASTPTIMSPDFSPWLYRPTPLQGYLPLQPGFITSRFAGTYLSNISGEISVFKGTLDS